MMFAGLFAGVIALYFIIGWMVLLATRDPNITQPQNPGRFFLDLLLWPIMAVVRLAQRGKQAADHRDDDHDRPRR